MSSLRKCLSVIVILQASLLLYSSFITFKYLLFVQLHLASFDFILEMLKVFGEFLSSIYLIAGIVASAQYLVFFCVLYFSMETLAVLWNLGTVYDNTFGCRENKSIYHEYFLIECPPHKSFLFYKELFTVCKFKE